MCTVVLLAGWWREGPCLVESLVAVVRAEKRRVSFSWHLAVDDNLKPPQEADGVLLCDLRN